MQFGHFPQSSAQGLVPLPRERGKTLAKQGRLLGEQE
jgi:hypothetical protein